MEIGQQLAAVSATAADVVGELGNKLGGPPSPTLLWRQEFTIDVSRRLSPAREWVQRYEPQAPRQAARCGERARWSGTRFAYDGETVTIIEMFPAGHGNLMFTPSAHMGCAA